MKNVASKWWLVSAEQIFLKDHIPNLNFLINSLEIFVTENESPH